MSGRRALFLPGALEQPVLDCPAIQGLLYCLLGRVILNLGTKVLT